LVASLAPIRADALDAPVLPPHFGGTTLPSTNFSQSWQPVFGAAGYEVQISLQAGIYGGTPGVVSTTQASSSSTAIDVSDYTPGIYRYGVMAVGADGSVGPSAADSFAIAPRSPQLTNLVRGAVLEDNTFPCSWAPLAGATYYGIELLSQSPTSTYPTADPNRVGVAVLSGSDWPCNTAGLAAGRYWYRVVAWSGQGYLGGFSAPDSFVVPKETLSVDDSDPVHPVFSWQAFPTSTGYGIEILRPGFMPVHSNDTSADPNRLAIGITQPPVTTWNGDTIGLVPGLYVVRAIAWNANGFIGGFSDAEAFSVLPAVSVSVTPSPVIDNHPATIAVHTVPSAVCGVTVTYADGMVDTSPSFMATYRADRRGYVAWSWTPSTNAPGPAKAAVTCAIRGAQATAIGDFLVSED
jgi:hypothetical protein